MYLAEGLARVLMKLGFVNFNQRSPQTLSFCSIICIILWHLTSNIVSKADGANSVCFGSLNYTCQRETRGDRLFIKVTPFNACFEWFSGP